MQILTIFQKLFHFYFNYNYDALTPTYVSTTFSRRVQFAVRMVVSFLVGGFLVYGTGLNDQSTSQYLVPVMSILSVQETFGMTLSFSYEMILVIVPLSICLFIIQKIGLGYQDYLAGELLLLVSSFLVAYKCSQVTII